MVIGVVVSIRLIINLILQGLSQGVDQGGALGPADMVALAATYPFIFIKARAVCLTCSANRSQSRRMPVMACAVL